MSLVAKIEHFPPQKGDENESRRQKMSFSAQNDDEKESRHQKMGFPTSK